MARNPNLSSGQYADIDRALGEGGFSKDVVTGADPPGAGYLVSIPGHEERFGPHQPRAYTPPELPRYVQKHADALTRPGHYFGGWPIPRSRDVALDVSQHHADFPSAHRAMFRGGQEAMFNLSNFEDYPNVAHPAVQARRRDATKVVLARGQFGLQHPGA